METQELKWNKIYFLGVQDKEIHSKVVGLCTLCQVIMCMTKPEVRVPVLLQQSPLTQGRIWQIKHSVLLGGYGHGDLGSVCVQFLLWM